MTFGLWARCAQGIMYYIRSRSPMGSGDASIEGAILRGRAAHCKV